MAENAEFTQLTDPKSFGDALAEAWLVNNRVMLLMLAELKDGALEATLSERGGRSVGQQLAHVLEVRRDKLERADKALAATVPVVGREQGHDRAVLREGFEKSGEAIAELLRASGASGGAVKGFKRGAVALLGYLISHDAHHRGHALLTAKKCGFAPSQALRFGIWEWNKI